MGRSLDLSVSTISVVSCILGRRQQNIALNGCLYFMSVQRDVVQHCRKLARPSRSRTTHPFVASTKAGVGSRDDGYFLQTTETWLVFQGRGKISCAVLSLCHCACSWTMQYGSPKSSFAVATCLHKAKAMLPRLLLALRVPLVRAVRRRLFDLELGNWRSEIIARRAFGRWT